MRSNPTSPTISRKIGYARVSTSDQSPRLQRDALKAHGCDLIYVDADASGALRDRPALNQALSSLQPGDVLVVWRLDRLARSMRHLLDIIALLQGRKAGFESLSENFDTTTAFGQFALHIMGAVAELERQIIVERTRAGIRAAKDNGARLGRPQKLTQDNLITAYEQISAGTLSLEAVARQLGVHRITLKRGFERLKNSALTGGKS